MLFLKKKKNKINIKDRSELEVEEILHGDEENYFERRLEFPLHPKIFDIGLFVVFLVFILIIVWSLNLDLLKNDFYSARAEKNIAKTIYLPASRGLIFDRFGEKLVENMPFFQAALILDKLPFDYQERMEILAKVRKILNIDKSYLDELISRADFENQKTIIIKEELSREEAIVLDSQDLAGVKVILRNYREYKDGPIFSHILGFIGKEDNWREIGRAGLESFYNDALSGKIGEEKVIESKNISVKKPILGENITITIDAGLQRFIFQRLKTALQQFNSPAAVALAIDPNNGEILSLVSLPSYDNNLFSKGVSQKDFEKFQKNSAQSFFNRAVSGLYPPASTIKPLIALAALQEKIIDPKFKIDDRYGLIKIPNPYNPDKPTIFKDWKTHGLVDIKGAIAASCDVYFYAIGGGLSRDILKATGFESDIAEIKGLGIDKIREYFNNFNLGAKTGVDLPNEETGFLPDPALREKKGGIWRIGDTYNTSIGQGEFLITPLQLATYIMGMANGGIIWQPHFLKDKPPVILKNNLIDKNNLKIVQEGMREVISSPLGTGYMLNALPLKVAGKSGTAELIKGKKFNSIFVAYAPSDKPQIVVLVLIEEAPEGILSATPVVYDILSWYYENRLKNNL